MNCSNCGNKTPNKVKFCSNCGTQLDTKQTTKPVQKKTPTSAARLKAMNGSFTYLSIFFVALVAIGVGAFFSNTDSPPTSQGAEPDFENMTLRKLCTEYPLVAQSLGRSCKNFQSYATPTPPENLADFSNRKDRSSESEAENKQPDGEIHYFRDIDDYKGDVLEDCITYQTILDGAIDYSPLLLNEGMKFRRYMKTTFTSPEFARIYQAQSEAIYNSEDWTWPETLSKFSTICYQEAGFRLEGN